MMTHLMRFFAGKAIPLALLLFLYSCEKTNTETIVYGQIVDGETNLPMQDVRILQNTYCPASLTPAYTVEIARSDAEGKFEVKTGSSNVNGCNRYLTVQSPGYDGSRLSIRDGAINECYVKLARNSVLKLRIKNTSPVDANDYINFSIGALAGTRYGSDKFWGYGPAIDTNLTYTVLPNYLVPLTWYVRKNNVNSQFHQDVYCPSGDTVYFSIFY